MRRDDLFQEWQRAEAACITAYRSVYAKVRNGAYVSVEELSSLAQLSNAASDGYHRYPEHITHAGGEVPEWRRAADEERAKLPGPPAKG